MKKIDQKLVKVKAGVPFPLYVNGGFDCYGTEFKFEYDTRYAFGKKLEFLFKQNEFGQDVSNPVQFDEKGFKKFLFTNGELGLLDTNFQFIEFLSTEDLIFAISAEVPEVAFC